MNILKTRVGINGLGRIGRAILVLAVADPKFEVVFCNDLVEGENLEYLLNYDSTYGRPEKNWELKAGFLTLDSGPAIRLTSDPNLWMSKIDWSAIDVLIDSSGVTGCLEGFGKLTENGVLRKLLVTHSAKTGVDIDVIWGANQEKFDPRVHKIISSSICDANAVGPVLAHLLTHFGLDWASIVTLHPWLNYQNLLDGSLESVSSPGHSWKDYTLGRSSLENLIPKSTTAGEAILRALPELEGRISTFSYRVPTSIVASAVITARLKKMVNISDVLSSIAKSSLVTDGDLILSSEPLVSSDFKGTLANAVLDLRWSAAIGERSIQLVLWYDNERGYASRALKVARLIAK